jgi:hypothetical protein
MIVRRFLRLGIPPLIGVLVVFCLVAVVRAQAWLNRQAELYQQAALSLNATDAAPQAIREKILVAANTALRFAGEPPPPTTVGAISGREDIGHMTGNGGLKALAAAQPNERARCIRSPEPVQRVTPDPMPAEGKKVVTANVIDSRSRCAPQISISDPINPERAPEQDEVRLTPVTVFRSGAQPTVYRVPKE